MIKELTITVLLIVGTPDQQGLSTGQARSAIKVVERQLKMLPNFKLRPILLRRVRNTLPQHIFQGAQKRFEDWRNEIQMRILEKRLQINSEYYVIIDLPAQFGNHFTFSGGLGFICPQKSVPKAAWAGLTQYYYRDGADLTYFNGIAMTHEIGHLLGAAHDDPNKRHSIMNGNIANLPIRNFRGMYWSKKSLQEISLCRRGKFK